MPQALGSEAWAQHKDQPMNEFVAHASLTKESKAGARRAYVLAEQRGHNPGAFVPGRSLGVAAEAVCKRCFGPILLETNGAVSAPRLCR